MSHLKRGWPHPTCMNVLHIDRNVTKRIESIQEVLLYFIYWCIYFIWTDIDECTTGQHTCHHHARCLNNEVSTHEASSTAIFKGKLENISPFCVAIGIPVLNFWWGLQSQGRTLTWMLLLLRAMAFSDTPVVRHLLTSWWPSIATLRIITSSTSIELLQKMPYYIILDTGIIHLWMCGRLHWQQSLHRKGSYLHRYAFNGFVALLTDHVFTIQPLRVCLHVTFLTFRYYQWWQCE